MNKSNFFVYYYYIIIIIIALLYSSNKKEDGRLNIRSKFAAAAEEREKVGGGIVVFGDSIVDPGNNNYIATIGRANFPPYGRDFPGGIPTGRYSNGKVPSDLLGTYLLHFENKKIKKLNTLI